TQFYLDTSLGFRAPSFVDLTEQDRAAGDFVIPSLDLDPEYFVTFELGSKWQLAGDAVRGRVSGYYTILSGLLVRDPTGNLVGGLPEVRYANAGDGYVLGFDVSLTVAPIRDLEFTLSGSYSSGEVDTPSNGRDFLSKHNPAAGRFGVRYIALRTADADEKPRLWFELFVQGAFKQGQLSASDIGDTQRIPPGGTPGWVTLNFRSAFDINETVQAFINVLNITNTNYRIHGSGDNEPGFNLLFGFELTF
ncbi:MAG: TonB-dependent receptor, partial [Planctomycetota bacterium]